MPEEKNIVFSAIRLGSTLLSRHVTEFEFEFGRYVYLEFKTEINHQTDPT